MSSGEAPRAAREARRVKLSGSSPRRSTARLTSKVNHLYLFPSLFSKSGQYLVQMIDGLDGVRPLSFTWRRRGATRPTGAAPRARLVYKIWYIRT